MDLIENLIFVGNNTTKTISVTSSTHAPYSSISFLYNGIASFLFPFLLVFAIVYGVLEKVDFFKGRHDVNSIIAFVMAIIFATTNYALNLTYIILPIAAILIVVLFIVILLFSMVQTGFGTTLKLSARLKLFVGSLVAVIISILLIYLFIPTQGIGNYVGVYAPYVVIAVIFIMIIYAVSK